MTTDAANSIEAQRLSLWQAGLGLLLRRLRAGELYVAMRDGREYRFSGPDEGPVARVNVNDDAACRRLALAGDIGLAEGYMEGSWDTPDLHAVLELGLENISRGWPGHVPFLRKPAHRVAHRRNDNDTKGGARRNIAYHYDLGNDFYRLWLDETMTYSSACWEEAGLSGAPCDLASAQRHKWDRMLDLLQPSRRDHLLEIGCGWGGFAIHAARECGCRVTGLTLSEAQLEQARQRVVEAGLEGRVDLRLQDYRTTLETYDGIASIEMFEAVGRRWWPVFFRRLRELMHPGKAAALQVITIEDSRFDDYVKHPDFAQLYIFPGGMLPSPERFRAEAAAAQLAVGEPRFFGHDYAKTLIEWSRRFDNAIPRVRELGFDERFVRMWRYYLAYCRTGFEYGSTDVMQVRLES